MFETEGKVRYGNYYGSNCLIEKSTGEFSGTSVFSSLSRKHLYLAGTYLILSGPNFQKIN